MHTSEDATERDLLTVSDVANLLNIDVRTVHRRIARGIFPGAFKLPGRTGTYLIPRSAVPDVANGDAK